MNGDNGYLNIADFATMNIPDDLKGLAKEVMELNEKNQYSMLLPVIGVAMLIDRITRLEEQAFERQSDLEEEDKIRNRLAQLLTETANALHKGPKENGFWSWHDLPKLAEDAMTKIKQHENQS